MIGLKVASYLYGRLAGGGRPLPPSTRAERGPFLSIRCYNLSIARKSGCEANKSTKMSRRAGREAGNSPICKVGVVFPSVLKQEPLPVGRGGLF